MIQTQLLQLDKPYQIISAGGQVGIQVATLIVTEEKQTEDGGYFIDTHSHPVVNYGLKQDLEAAINYGSSHPQEVYRRNQRLKPEGAVWNRVEVRDVHVLGLAGAKNDLITFDQVMWLIPSATPFMPFELVWDEMTVTRISKLFFGFEQVGIQWSRLKLVPGSIYDNHYSIPLQLDYSTSGIPLVKVIIKQADPNDPMDSDIFFRCRLFDPSADSDINNRYDEQQQPNISGCVKNIVQIINELKTWILDTPEIRFSAYSSVKPDPLDEVIEQVAYNINKVYRPD